MAHPPRPSVTALKQTCVAVPSQWEGTLADGRALYIRYRYGELSLGTGHEIDDAVRNSASENALLADEIGEGLDGYMTFTELKEATSSVLDFPNDLVVENERTLEQCLSTPKPMSS